MVPGAVANLNAAAARRLLAALSLTLHTQSRQRSAHLEFYIQDVITPLRHVVTRAEIKQATVAERGREDIFRQRQRARIRLKLGAALAEKDPERRERRVRGVLTQEQHYNRLRERAIAARVAGAANARNVRDGSPAGAVWLLGHRHEHCPGCTFLHGHALTWRALIAARHLPPVGPGCGCELRGIRQAWLSALTGELLDDPRDDESFGLIATAKALGHPHGHDGGATAIGMAA